MKITERRRRAALIRFEFPACLAGTVQARAGGVEALDERTAKQDSRKNDDSDSDRRHNETVFGEGLAVIVVESRADAREDREDS